MTEKANRGFNFFWPHLFSGSGLGLLMPFDSWRSHERSSTILLWGGWFCLLFILFLHLFLLFSINFCFWLTLIQFRLRTSIFVFIILGVGSILRCIAMQTILHRFTNVSNQFSECYLIMWCWWNVKGRTHLRGHCSTRIAYSAHMLELSCNSASHKAAVATMYWFND